MPPAPMRGDGRMAKDPKKTLLRLLSYLKNYWPILLIVLGCIFAIAAAGAIILGKIGLISRTPSFPASAVAVAAALLYPASWALSVHWYEKREF